MKSKIKYVIASMLEMAKKSAAKTGKSLILTIFDIIYCSIRYGASPRNYYWFGFYELNSTQRKTFVTHLMSEKIQKQCNNNNSVEIFRNKQMFFYHFSEFMKRRALSTSEVTAPSDIRNIGDKIIYKPINGSQGIGIKVIQTKSFSDAELMNIIRELPMGVLETWIEQHKELDKLCSSAVNIIRIVTARKDEDFRLLASTLTVAKKLEYANASGDAIFANVDVSTGYVISDGCDYDEVVYSEHPITKMRFKDFAVPYWNETVEMLFEASKVVPDVQYVGWDVAITPTGPVIIEGNNDPGYEWMQLRMINPSGIGKKKEYSFLLE